MTHNIKRPIGNIVQCIHLSQIQKIIILVAQQACLSSYMRPILGSSYFLKRYIQVNVEQPYLSVIQVL